MKITVPEISFELRYAHGDWKPWILTAYRKDDLGKSSLRVWFFASDVDALETIAAYKDKPMIQIFE